MSRTVADQRCIGRREPHHRPAIVPLGSDLCNNWARFSIAKRESPMPCTSMMTPLLESGRVCQPEIVEPDSLRIENATALSSRGGLPTELGCGAINAPATNHDINNTITRSDINAIKAKRMIRCLRLSCFTKIVSFQKLGGQSIPCLAMLPIQDPDRCRLGHFCLK